MTIYVIILYLYIIPSSVVIPSSASRLAAAGLKVKLTCDKNANAEFNNVTWLMITVPPTTRIFPYLY